MGREEVGDPVQLLADETMLILRMADVQAGRYPGQIVSIDQGLVVQETVDGEGVVHDTSKMDLLPHLGARASVIYKAGVAQVVESAQMSMDFADAPKEVSTTGKILDVRDGIVVQRKGRDGQEVRHDAAMLLAIPEVDAIVSIKYDKASGFGLVKDLNRDIGQGIGGR